jgi:hypothetical protein
MKEKIEGALAVLVGLPLWSAGRVADLEWFQFGARHTVKGFRGDEKEVGEYALHTQCPWRITGPHGIVVAFLDRFTPRGNPEKVGDDFDPNQPGTTLCDERMDAFFAQQGKTSLVAEQIKVGDWGTFSLALMGGFSLDVFPDDSLSNEHWRFFRPYLEIPHLVVTGSGTEGP